MQRRTTIGSSPLPKIPSTLLDELRKSNVKRSNSEIIARASDNLRSPKMIFSSKNIRTSFTKGQLSDLPLGRRIVLKKTLSDGQNSVVSTTSSVSDSVSEKEDSFSSMSIPEFATPTVTANGTPVPTVTTPVLAASPIRKPTQTTPIPTPTQTTPIPTPTQTTPIPTPTQTTPIPTPTQTTPIRTPTQTTPIPTPTQTTPIPTPTQTTPIPTPTQTTPIPTPSRTTPVPTPTRTTPIPTPTQTTPIPTPTQTTPIPTPTRTTPIPTPTRTTPIPTPTRTTPIPTPSGTTPILTANSTPIPTKNIPEHIDVDEICVQDSFTNDSSRPASVISTSEHNMSYSINETSSFTTKSQSNGLSVSPTNDALTSEVTSNALPQISDIPTPPPSPPSADNDGRDDTTSYDLTTVADILQSLSPTTSLSSPPVLNFPPPPSSPPPDMSQSEYDYRDRLPTTTPPPNPHEISIQDLTPPPSPEPPLRTSSRSNNHILSLSVKRSHSPTDDQPANGMDSPPSKRVPDIHPLTSRQPDHTPSPPPPPPPPVPVVVEPEPFSRTRVDSQSESDVSNDYRSEDEILKYFNKTVIGENTLSSDSSSQMGDLPGLSLPKDDYFAANDIDKPIQSKGDNSLSPTDNQKVIKWNDRIKTTRNAIKPGTVDELKQVYLKLGEENFKPSVIKKRKKEGLKLTRSQQMKRYKKVIDMFSEEESLEEPPYSPTSTTLRNVEVIEKSENDVLSESKVETMETNETVVKNDVQSISRSDSFMRDTDRWDSEQNDESNPYSRANIIAFLNKRLATIQNTQKKNFEDAKKKESKQVSSRQAEDSNALMREVADPVLESTQFNSTMEQRNSYSGHSRDEGLIDSHGEYKPGEQLNSGSIHRNISLGHVTETGTQRDDQAVSSATDIQIGFDSKQDGGFSQEQPYGIRDVLQTDESRAEEKQSAYRRLFFDDEPEAAPVNSARSEGDASINEGSLHTAVVNSEEYTTPMFSNGAINSSSDNTASMSAAVGEVQSFDIHRRVSGVSRSTSGASGPRDTTEESRSGVYVVQDNVGDLYVVEDISDKTRETATLDQNGRIISTADLDLSHTMDTTQSSIRSFDFNGPDSSKITVDGSEINYGKAKEVISTLFDNMNTADRSLAVTNFRNDSVERSNVTFSESSVTSDQVMNNMAGHADNHTSVKADDTDMALHEDVYKKTTLNIVTDDKDRPLWSEQTTDTQVKAWMENGEDADTGNDYKTSITLSSRGNQGMDMITPAPDYPGTEADNRHVSTYTVSLADSQTGNSSLTNSLRSGSFHPAPPEPVIQDVTQGVTVTTTTSTVIGQKVDMLVDVPQVENVHMRRNQNDQNVNSYRSSSVNSYDRGRITNGYGSDSDLSEDDRRHSKSYTVRQIKSSSLDRNDSSRSGGQTRYITRIESIPKSNRPNIQKTYYTSSDTMTTRVDNTRSSFGEADSQYGSQTSKGTSGEGSPGDDSPRYRVVRAEMSPTYSFSTPKKHTLYREVEEKPTQSDFYEYKTFTSEESVNREGNLWRVNSPVRSTPDTSVSNAVVFRAHDSRPDRSSPERYRVSKTISAEDLFSPGQDKRDHFYRNNESLSSEREQKLYKTVTNFEFGKSNQSPGRKRRHGTRDGSDSDDDQHGYPDTMYRVSNVKKDEQFVSKKRSDYDPEPEDDKNHMYKVVRVTPSDRSKKAERRVAKRSFFGSDSKEPVYSDDEGDTVPGPNYRIGKTRSTEDLIVTRSVSTRSDKRDSSYQTTVSPTRFDSGYFDDTITRKDSTPSHTTVIRLDPGHRRQNSTDSPRTLYRVVNVKSEENLADDSMWNNKRSPKIRQYDGNSSDSDDERQGKYRLSPSRYPPMSPEYPSSPEQERKSRRDQTKYYVQKTFSPSRVEDSDPVILKRIRSKSPETYYRPPPRSKTPQSYYSTVQSSPPQRARSKSPQSYFSRLSTPPEWHKSSTDVSRNYTSEYESTQRSTSYTSLSPTKESKNYVVFSNNDDRGRPLDRSDSEKYKAEKTFYLRSTSPAPHKTSRNLSRSYSNDLTGDSGTGTDIVSDENDGNGEYTREQRYSKRVEQQIYTVRQEPLRSEIPDEADDLKVERGKILIRNKIDPNKDDDDFDDNVNVFDNEFHLQKDNPLYQSDQDLYRKFDDEDEVDFSNQVTQDITFETVDRIAQRHKGGRQVQLSPKPIRKQNLSALLLSKLANIDSKDIRQHIDVEHHNEEIYGELDFIHADGTRSGSGNTDNFDAVNEKVNLTLKEGKAFVIIKVIAERVVPIDYEFNVWRKSSAIVTRQIEIDLLANDQRRRLYDHVMENAGARGALEGGAYGPHSMTSTDNRNDNELSSMDTLKLFSQILSVAEGQGDADETSYATRQVQGRLSSSGSHDLLY